jgi:hypothetical protein
VKRKKELKSLLQEGVERFCKLQEKLYAHDQWGVLLIFQAMDAAGNAGPDRIGPSDCIESPPVETRGLTQLDHRDERALLCLRSSSSRCSCAIRVNCV